jgi:hypothetical protein
LGRDVQIGERLSLHFCNGSSTGLDGRALKEILQIAIVVDVETTQRRGPEESFESTRAI